MEMNGFSSSDCNSNDFELPVICQVKHSLPETDEVKNPAQRSADSGYHSWGNIQDSSNVRESNVPLSKACSASTCMTMQSISCDINERNFLKRSMVHQTSCAHVSTCSSTNDIITHGIASLNSSCNKEDSRIYCHSHNLDRMNSQTELNVYDKTFGGNSNHISHFKLPQNAFEIKISKLPLQKENFGNYTSKPCMACNGTALSNENVSVNAENNHIVNSDESGVNRRNYCALHMIEVTTSQALQADQQQAQILSTNALGHSKEKVKSEAQDLAAKIEFCLMFGYTAAQIRSAITKLSYRATKNDILLELSNSSAQSSASMQHQQFLSIVDQEDVVNSHIQNERKVGGLIALGLSSPSNSMLKSRGPSTTGNGDKDKGDVSATSEDDSQNLRPIVIDGSNVAMSHGNKQYFSCKGILLTVDYFRNRNHRDITVFLPTYRKESSRPDAPIKDREILDKLEQERILVYTPSRYIDGKRVTCYDDRFILRLAQETDGVIVSNDNFRDLQNEKPDWKALIEKRLLMYSFVSDRFMPPDDPLGRNGPNIDNFLRKRPVSEEQSKPQCPFGIRCTYGKKCKYFHPECSRSVTDEMKKKSDKRCRTSDLAENMAAELVHKASPSVKDDNAVHGNANRMLPPNHLQALSPSLMHHTQRNAQSLTTPMPSNGSIYQQSPGLQTPSLAYRNSGDNLPENFSRALSLSDANYPRVPRSSYNSNPSLPNDAQMLHSFHNHPTCQAPYRYSDPSPPDFHLRNHNMFCVPPYRPNSHGAQPMYDSGVRVQSPLNSVNAYQCIPAPNPGYVPHPALYPGHQNEPHLSMNQHLHHQLLYRYAAPPTSQARPTVLSSSFCMSSYTPSSQGSNSSLSYSYPCVAPSDRTSVVGPSSHNGSIPNSDSDPKTYPPCSTRRVCSMPNQEHFYAQNFRQPACLNNATLPPDVVSREQRGSNNVDSPRHHLFSNLRRVFHAEVVERVMNSNPNVSDPKRIIKMCLAESDPI